MPHPRSVVSFLAIALVAPLLHAALAVAPTSLFPAPGAAQACVDTPLRLSFAEPVARGKAGLIRIVDASDGQVVDTIDVAKATDTRTIGGAGGFQVYPVIVDGDEAEVAPHSGRLQYGKSYYVTADAGAFVCGGRPSEAIRGPAAWRFSTKAAGPKPGSARLVVAADGSGDFCTVQAALDFVPAGNDRPVTIFIRKGLYREIVFFAQKNDITLQGESRTGTIIAYANNARFNPSGGNPFEGESPNPAAAHVTGGHIYRRGVLLAHRVQNLSIVNLTIHNLTPYGGSQAEAIILNGTTSAHAILKGLDLYSYQDTLQINGQAYVTNCHFDGDVDFLWGTGPCYFEGCTFRSLHSGRYFTQIRNPASNHGYVFHRCVFEGAPGVKGNYLSRIAPNRFPHSEVVLIDCRLSSAVGPTAWQLKNDNRAPVGDCPNIHFWEYDSRTPDGAAVDMSGRNPHSRRLEMPADEALIRDYSNPVFVLGGWNPLSSPTFGASADTRAG